VPADSVDAIVITHGYSRHDPALALYMDADAWASLDQWNRSRSASPSSFSGDLGERILLRR
jgi:hypothetical protein